MTGITNETIWSTDFAAAERKAGIDRARRWCLQQQETERLRGSSSHRDHLPGRFLASIAAIRQIFIPLVGHLFR